MAKLSSCLDEATAGSLNETRLDLTRGQHKKSFYATCGGIPTALWGKVEEKRETRKGQEKKVREDQETRADRLLSSFVIFTSHCMLRDGRGL